MTTRCASRTGVAIARRELDELAARLCIALPPVARPGADLAVRTRRGRPWPVPAPLLRTADGWVHPGPPTAWSSFVDMVTAMGASWPVLDALTTDQIDAEAAAWMVPAAVVRTTPAVPDPIPEVASSRLDGAAVVLFGTAWATPLVGLVLARLGARVVKVEHPGRPDRFPLRDDLVVGQEVVPLDLGVEPDRGRAAALVEHADLVVEGHPPRVLANAGIRPTARGAARRRVRRQRPPGLWPCRRGARRVGGAPRPAAPGAHVAGGSGGRPRRRDHRGRAPPSR